MATHAPTRITRSQRAELLRGIYVILNEDNEMLERARAVLDAGVRILQYRAKGSIVAPHLRSLRELTRERDALLIMNDDWRSAAAYECDGVHLGRDDDGFSKVATVRAALPRALIGLSCGSIEEVVHANAEDADYLGVGSVYATPTKLDAGEPIGIDGLCRLARATTIPIAAVGGITLATVSRVRTSGVAMAAVISAIADAADPNRAARDLIARWHAAA